VAIQVGGKWLDSFRCFISVALHCNESECKFLCHNIVVVHQAIMELGIEAKFWNVAPMVIDPSRNCVAVVQERRDDYEEFRFSD
jgi:hypothetical protein